MIGRMITHFLVENGDHVAWLSRSPKSSNGKIKHYTWDPKSGFVDQNAIEWATHIINLAGVSIGETRWTSKGKADILNSRIQTVETLVKAVLQKSTALDGFVGVSGLGYYGPGKEPQKEENNPGTDFPAQVAESWEKAYFRLQNVNRVAILRLTVVLSSTGGALPKIMMPIQYGIGAALGNGTQPFSWIHLEDAAHAFVEALNWNGVYNVAAPETLTNKIITQQIAEILHRPIWLPAVPAFVLKLALGDRSGLVLNGTVPDLDKLNQTEFRCHFTKFKDAIADLISRKL